MDSYCIKPEYVARTNARTKVENIEDYWTEQRIRLSGQYQWDVYRLAAQHLTQHPGASVADVGCGYPRKAQQLLAPQADRLTLFDQPSMAPLMAAQFPQFDFVPVDLEAGLGEYDRQFDCVVCADVIEHLIDPTALVNVLKALLAPSGYLFISTPERDAAHGKQCTASKHPEHVREWNLEEFQNYLRRCGLQVRQQQQLPFKRLNPLLAACAPVLAGLNPARFRSCQLVVCQLQ